MCTHIDRTTRLPDYDDVKHLSFLIEYNTDDSALDSAWHRMCFVSYPVLLNRNTVVIHLLSESLFRIEAEQASIVSHTIRHVDENPT